MANAYKQAGVDIEAGYEAVYRMKKHVKHCRAGIMERSAVLEACLIYPH